MPDIQNRGPYYNPPPPAVDQAAFQGVPVNQAYHPYYYQRYPVQPTVAATAQYVMAPFGMDLTGQEARARNVAVAENGKTNQPQPIAPGDPDPLRMYWVRDHKDEYTLQNRITIESGDIGEHTWWINPIDNSFYAVVSPKAKKAWLVAEFSYVWHSVLLQLSINTNGMCSQLSPYHGVMDAFSIRKQ